MVPTIFVVYPFVCFSPGVISPCGLVLELFLIEADVTMSRDGIFYCQAAYAYCKTIVVAAYLFSIHVFMNIEW